MRAWPLLFLLAGCHAAAGGAGLGDPQAGAKIITREACGSCHQIPGIPLANGNVGPPLDRIGGRMVIVGTLPNSAQNMVRWLRSPQSVAPGNAMPDMGLSEQQARDVAAYLYRLR